MDRLPQPRIYRVELYRDGNRRLLERNVVTVLDFSPGPGLRATEGSLDGLVQSLAYQDGARGRRTLDYYLGLYDEATNELRCHWPAKTWFED